VEVRVDVQRFESRLGAEASVEALWSVRRGDGQPRTGRSFVSAPVRGPGYDALVAAHAQAVARLGQEIAGVVRAEALALKRP
jgi:uncharacterized lipoprotein YmbA